MSDRRGGMREERLGFRVDKATKALIERAAEIEHRKVTDFCMSALIDAAQQTIARHDSLSLSDQDRTAFFAALENPPAVHPRLQRALDDHRRRVDR